MISQSPDMSSSQFNSTNSQQQKKIYRHWKEFKVQGKNIHSRSYAGIASVDNLIYIFGGYQLTLGIMKDFYSVNMKNSEGWIQLKSPQYGRYKHTMFGFDQKIYLFGGQYKQQLSTNKLEAYDITQKEWEVVQTNYIPPFDNNAFTLDSNQGKLYIFGGYQGENLYEQTNSMYYLAIKEKKWTKINYNSQRNPSCREGAGLTKVKENLFVYGGFDGTDRLGDLWKYDLQTNLWNEILLDSGSIPKPRNGMTFSNNGKKLIMFGGIHDITWELDDLWEYNLETQKWWAIEDDSRKSDPRITKQQVVIKPQTAPSPGKRLTFKTAATVIKSIMSPMKKSSRARTANSIGEQEEYNKTNGLSSMEEQKLKEMEHRKVELLKIFEVPEIQEANLRTISPTSEAMKNSLRIIGYKDQKRQKPVLELMVPFQSKPMFGLSNFIEGKKPCARDGHKFVEIGQDLVIFGGDRHQMTFNDIHLLMDGNVLSWDILSLIKEVKQKMIIKDDISLRKANCFIYQKLCSS